MSEVEKKAKEATKPVKAMPIADDCAVAFHYKLCEVTKDGSHGEWLEQSTGDNPLWYLHGHKNVIPGLELALTGKKVGDKIEITLEPKEAYGERQSNSFQRVPIKHLHLSTEQKHLKPGMVVGVQTGEGVRTALVVKVGRFNVDLDTNHPFAGRTLHYQVEIVEVRKADAQELAHRHIHGPGAHQH